MNATIDPILAYRAELYGAATRRRIARRRRRLVFVAVAIVAALVTGFSIAATGWFTASPAPPAVVEDFKAYTPQLGFHPEPGRALFVAQDGDFRLYATTNREGTYCLVADLPWRRPESGEGGVCVSKRDARELLTASVIGSSNSWLVVAGRVSDAKARTITFATPQGDSIDAPLGAEGFFVVGVGPTSGLCPSEDWAATFSALDGDGQLVREERILLVTIDPHLCGFPTIPQGPELRRGPILYGSGAAEAAASA